MGPGESRSKSGKSGDESHGPTRSLEESRVQAKMQQCLDRLGLPLKVCWTPDPGRDKHGLIEPSSNTLFLFDQAEEDAWQTFLHEALEWKLKDVTKVYRVTINGLIEIIEKLSYGEKEKFLESIPNIFRVIEEGEQTCLKP